MVIFSCLMLILILSYIHNSFNKKQVKENLMMMVTKALKGINCRKTMVNILFIMI